MVYNCDEIRKKMDVAGRKREAFFFAVDFEMNEGIFVLNPLLQQEILFNIKGVSNITLSDSDGTTSSLFTQPNYYLFEAQPEDFNTYLYRFNMVMDGLRRGDSYLTNLTIRTPILCSLSLEEIFHFSNASYKVLLPNKWICFSPECFIRIKERKIWTFPMKGTIDAKETNAEEIILNDPKEAAEHNTIVDLLRNDISKIASSVKVNRFRYIDTIQTNQGAILQISSEIEGHLPDNYLDRIGSLFFQLLPAGSISGAPKDATLHLIQKAERKPRGFYTGIAGYFDGKTLESFVLIRYIEQQNSQLFFRSGGGITVNSEARKEYNEAIQKVYLPF